MTYKSLTDNRIVTVLANGGVGVIPTDTVYGLVCVACNQAAVSRLYGLKKRKFKPGTLIAANIDQLVELGLETRSLKAVEHFWPGAISIVIACGPKLEYIHLGALSIAVRIPKNKNLTLLLEKTGPLLTTSANLPDKPPANTISEARAYFGNKVDFYVDGGNLSAREPSTVIHIVGGATQVLRPGAVKLNEIRIINR